MPIAAPRAAPSFPPDFIGVPPECLGAPRPACLGAPRPECLGAPPAALDVVSYAPPATFAKRADFLRLAARGRKISRPGFVMQVLRAEGGLRVGYTATKKIGNAVARNRARRRLKEAARLTLAELAPAGVELVLICRRETATMPFEALKTGLRVTLGEALK